VRTAARLAAPGLLAREPLSATCSVSCVLCGFWMCWLQAAETHTTVHWESVMRYQSRPH
jgi:hypothetical protein